MPQASAADILWSQYLLAAALDHVARRSTGKNPFCYVDTHAGPGISNGTGGDIQFLNSQIQRFTNRVWFDALAQTSPNHPGSWVVASRVLSGIPHLVGNFEIDANDIDPLAAQRMDVHRETGRVRIWSQDWFVFLRDRINSPRPVDFVFIDPPRDDPRGPAYAVDAALLLDTLARPYMITYPDRAPQDVIDVIGRTALEFDGGGGNGVILGGGAQGILMPLLPDLRELAALLGGQVSVRTPSNDDYII